MYQYKWSKLSVFEYQLGYCFKFKNQSVHTSKTKFVYPFDVSSSWFSSLCGLVSVGLWGLKEHITNNKYNITKF